MRQLEADAARGPADDSAVERTARLAEEAGGEVVYVDHPGRGDRSVLVLPAGFADGETPLIVSLHGYGRDSAYQSMYVPLHERVNADGFALLLPNASPDGEGHPSWNPTDRCCDGGKAGHDDVAYLTELLAETAKIGKFGQVYFFGYSNGGFMAYHMACKGLPGLRAVASLAGTSYVEDSSCDGAAPVSVLHIHGTSDDVILFDGDEIELDPKGDATKTAPKGENQPPPDRRSQGLPPDATKTAPEGEGERSFYAGAEDMVMRWSRRAGCDWPEHAEPYASLDLDRSVPGSETHAFRLESDCAEGVGIELWKSAGSEHAPHYGYTFTDSLLDWLLSQA